MKRKPRIEAKESFILPHLYTKLTPGIGIGVFTMLLIKQGDLIGISAGGKIWKSEEMRPLKEKWGDYFHQVEDDRHWGPKSMSDVDTLDRLNHSCDPNVVIIGNMCFYALRNIAPDEELVWDYATTESEPDYGFLCKCSSKLCRKKMSGKDWQIPKLQERYVGYFAPYLQKKINKLGGA